MKNSNIAKQDLKNAKKRTGLEHITFHDLGHVRTSSHAMNETLLMILQDLGS